MTHGLANLVFSTRSRHPTGGADAVREVIAASPGVGEAARREFAARADLGGSLLHAELAGPVYSFSPVDRSSWLFCRAVSLGRYRKGAHQFLVHGVLLGPSELATVDGNPLLLDRSGTGLELLTEHPGAGTVLPPLALAADDPGAARAANRRRFAELAAGQGTGDDWFPAAWAALGRGERLALVDPRPRADLVEWLLLHLHPDDRPHVGFHTWYSHGRPLDYRLLVTAPQEAARVRGQFRGLRLVETAGGEGGGPSGDRHHAGELALRLRRRDPEAFQRTLTDFHLTRLADRPLPPLDEEDVALCLAAAVHGEGTLDDERRGRLDLLRLRGEPAAALRYAIGDLAAAWRRDPADFAATLDAMAGSLEVEPGAIVTVAAALARDAVQEPTGDAAERWALLALLDRLATGGPASGEAAPGSEVADVPSSRRLSTGGSEAASRGRSSRPVPPAPWRDEQGGPAGVVRSGGSAAGPPRGDGPADIRVPTWRAVVPHGCFGELVRGFDEPRARAAEDALAAYVVAAAEDDLRASTPGGGAGGPHAADADDGSADWPALLAWLAARGRDAGAVAAAIETLARSAPPPRDVRWLRRLGDLRAMAGEPREALRVWLDGEAPRLAGEARRRRVEAVVGWALTHGVEGLDRFLDHPELADAVPAAVGAWAAGETDAEVAWRRLEALVADWRLAPAAAPAVGALLARLAASPLAHRVPEVVATLARTPGAGDPGRFLGIALAVAADRLTPWVTTARGRDERLRAVIGAGELLGVRNGHPGATAADGPLLRLALPALLAAQDLGRDERATVVRFRDAWTGLLASRVARGLDGPQAPAGLGAGVEEDWLDLLLDDFARDPLRGAEGDPRYHFYLTLAWRVWAADPSTRRRLRLARGLRLPSVPAGAAWHRERIAAVVPAELAGTARAWLTCRPPAPVTT